MRHKFAILGTLLLAFSSLSAAAQGDGAGMVPPLKGAGATFPAPLYKKWIAAYQKAVPGAVVDYAVVGSGEGVKRFLADSVDFGASDAAMTDEQIAAARSGAVLVPVTAGEVVLAYNLPGVADGLKLSREVYVAMLAGKITRWNDDRIQSLNPGLALPDREITLVARLDSSGTTFALTNHLSAISADWRDRGAGVGKLIEWPRPTMLVRGNEGVASRIKYSVGAFGYVEYSFAKHLGLATAHLQNKAGKFVAPGAASGEVALAKNVGMMPANLRVFIPDPEGDSAYPIVTFSWLLLKERYSDTAKAEAVKRFVAWGLSNGQALSADLGFIPLPLEVAERSKAALVRVQ